MRLLKKITKNLIPYIFIRIMLRIKYRSLRRGKYRGYKPSGGYGEKMLPYISLLKDGTNIKVKNVFEIGANFAQDADFLREIFGLTPNNVYVFEAHPDIFKVITQIHSFNAYNNAVFNENKEISFYVHPLNHKDTGWSSIHKLPDTKEIRVQALRMDDFMETHGVEEISFLKIDVEGATYEVLEGFGKRLKDVHCIQLEAEHGDNWVLYDKIENILKQHGFELVLFERNYNMSQSDSFWVQKNCIKYTPW